MTCTYAGLLPVHARTPVAVEHLDLRWLSPHVAPPWATTTDRARGTHCAGPGGVQAGVSPIPAPSLSDCLYRDFYVPAGGGNEQDTAIPALEIAPNHR